MQNPRTTAGKTAHETKPGWGFVALISVMVACTCFGSLWLTGISAALFAFSAWRGGYMDETIDNLNGQTAQLSPKAEEGAAA